MFVLVVVMVAVAVCAPQAWGAFPGRDGNLVVATGNGLELVVPTTAAASPVCTDVVLCGHPAQPAVSQNGRAIAFVDTTSRRPVVIAADGSCLWCLLGARLTRRTGSVLAFTPGGRGVTVAGNGLWSVSLTGGRARRLFKGRVGGAVWSSRGLLAVVRGGWIWVGRPGPGKLRRLARGASPSFSPDSSRLALARGGYVWVVRIANRRERRLVRGEGPAWSPSGRRIAYIAPGGAVEIVGVHGGAPHRVGSVQGTSLDWQPLPGSERRACKPPRGSTVVASNSEAVVFWRSFYLIGCLKALGRTRVLASAGGHYGVVAVRLAGRFAGIEADAGTDYTIETLVDLGSGKATTLATSAFHSLDSLTLDSSGFAAWRKTVRPMSQGGVAAISCPSASLCVAGDGAGNILSSTNPTGGASAWSSAAVASGISGVSCPSVSLCVVTPDDGDVLTSTDPTGGKSVWRKTKIETGSPDALNYLDAVSCPSVSLCVAVDGNSHIFSSTDPTGGVSAWRKTKIKSGSTTGFGSALNAVSCPAVSLCVVGDSDGNIFTSTDPTGGKSAWRKAKIDRVANNSLEAISCPSVSLCVAFDLAGNPLTSTDPTGGAGTWTKASVRASLVGGVSCPSVSLCVAVDLAASIFSSTDPTGPASAWTKTKITTGSTNALDDVSCPSVSLCVAVDDNGNILSSTDPTGGANTWMGAIPGCAPQSFPCISEQLYAHDDHGTRVIDAAPPGQGNSIDEVALNGASLVLSWTHNGARRQLQLR